MKKQNQCILRCVYVEHVRHPNIQKEIYQKCVQPVIVDLLSNVKSISFGHSNDTLIVSFGNCDTVKMVTLIDNYDIGNSDRYGIDDNGHNCDNGDNGDNGDNDNGLW